MVLVVENYAASTNHLGRYEDGSIHHLAVVDTKLMDSLQRFARARGHQNTPQLESKTIVALPGSGTLMTVETPNPTAGVTEN